MGTNDKNAKTTKATSTANLPAMPALPKLPRKPKAKTNACGCGCGTVVARSFAPGHDARLLGWAIRVERGLVEVAPAPHTEAVRRLVAERAKRVPAAKTA